MYLLLINLLITFSLFFSLSCGSDEIMVKGVAGQLSPETPYAEADSRELPDDKEPTTIVKFAVPSSSISSATIDIKQNNVSVTTLTFNSLLGFSGEALLYIGQTYSAEATATCSSNNQQVTQAQTFTVSESTSEVTISFVCGDNINHDTTKNITFNTQVTVYTPSISGISLKYWQCRHEIDVAHTVNTMYANGDVTFSYKTSIKVYLFNTSNQTFNAVSSFNDDFVSTSNVISDTLTDSRSNNNALSSPNNKIKVVVNILIQPSDPSISRATITYEQILTPQSSCASYSI